MSEDSTSLSLASTKHASETGSVVSEQQVTWGRNCYAINIEGSGQCLSSTKWFDMAAESAKLNRSHSTWSMGVGSPSQQYWICCKCRRATTDLKQSISKINGKKYYSCNVCFKQQRWQLIYGMIFRQLQLHLCFTMVWIPSPKGIFLGDRNRNHTEWAIIVTLLVITLVFQIAAFINALAVRPIAYLKHIYRKRPVLDFWIEAMSASGWVIIIAFMVYDGIHQYGNNTWDGRLIALLVCACVMLLSFLFTSYVAFVRMTKTNVTVIEGSPDPFGEKPKFDLLQAIAYMS